MAPVLIFRRKVKSGKVAEDTCHSYSTIAPWRPKVKVKVIVLYIWVAID
jgi:hypothetical protein